MGDGLRGKVALVTGGSRGIGRGTALALGQAGVQVGVNYRSHPEEAQAVVQAIEKAGSRAIAVPGDVSDEAAVERMIQQVESELGPLDIAVPNAAYSDRDLLVQADMAGIRRTVDVTLWGAFHVVRLAAQSMVKRGSGGSIVVVSSPHAFIPAPRAIAYNMSKAAIEQMAKTAAIELAEHRIRVNIIQPGWTDTPGERKFADEETLERGGKAIPWGRLGTADEMGRAIVFLCDPGSEYITGATLLVDGGISLPWWANRGSAAPG